MRARPLLLALLALPLMASDEDPPTLKDRYGEQVRVLTEAAAVDTTAYERLQVLCDEIGHRISGSAALERAIDWAAETMTADGFTVHKEPVTVPVWVRGPERGRLLAPMERELSLIGLGGTLPTPEGGVEAEVVVVDSFDALDALGEAGVSGRIVLYNVPFTTYGETVQYRTQGASRAAALGAVAVLIRSVTPVSLDTPHTGGVRYPEDGPGVPAAALSVEEAAWLGRLAAAGHTLRVHLELSSERRDDAPSFNVVADLPGREAPEEIVLLGCHLDSWDVGQGAQDDGSGCLIVWDAARLIAAQGMRPRRTVRVVLFTNEENGLRGGFNYAEVHADELPQHVAAIESDTGNGRADGFSLDLRAWPEDPDRLRAQGLMWQLEALLGPHGGGTWDLGGAGADVWPSVEAGVVGLGMNHDLSTYWPIHHTRADTFDKIVLADLQHNVGLMAATAWVLAEMPERLAEPPPAKRRRRR
ncbi:MAG: M20/M25/M40 family metallo-hydrolase [Alphaproteobacteria bacterium]|nr:M20/M25/M40 family metallo-hydrolase [Alphaproteobacteria bacterium]